MKESTSALRSIIRKKPKFYKMKIVLLSLVAIYVTSKKLTECNAENTTPSPPPPKVSSIDNIQEATPSSDEVRNNPRAFLNQLVEARAEAKQARVAASSFKAIAEEKTSKELHLSFNCAMHNFKISTDLLYNEFKLPNLRIHSAPLPKGVFEFIRNSDYYKINNIKEYSRFGDPDGGYARWLALVKCKPKDDYYNKLKWHSKPLKKLLADYYNAHEVKMPNCTITNLDEFYQYFAITMQRAYTVGCLFEHGGFSALNDGYSPEEDFIVVFHKILPKWSFTELELDLINIAWVVGGLLESSNDENRLKAGFHLKSVYKDVFDDPVIPVSNRCRKSNIYVEHVKRHL